MLDRKIKHLKFKFNLFKVKCLNKRIVKNNLKALKLSLYYIDKINIPKNEKENEELKIALALYDETIEKINEDINRCRKYVW